MTAEATRRPIMPGCGGGRPSPRSPPNTGRLHRIGLGRGRPSANGPAPTWGKWPRFFFFELGIRRPRLPAGLINVPSATGMIWVDRTGPRRQREGQSSSPTAPQGTHSLWDATAWPPQPAGCAASRSSTEQSRNPSRGPIPLPGSESRRACGDTTDLARWPRDRWPAWTRWTPHTGGILVLDGRPFPRGNLGAVSVARFGGICARLAWDDDFGRWPEGKSRRATRPRLREGFPNPTMAPFSPNTGRNYDPCFIGAAMSDPPSRWQRSSTAQGRSHSAPC